MPPFTNPKFQPAPEPQTAHAGTCGQACSCAPTREQIERRAYELYCAGGRAEGHGDQNWLQAEHQLAVANPVLADPKKRAPDVVPAIESTHSLV